MAITKLTRAIASYFVVLLEHRFFKEKEMDDSFAWSDKHDLYHNQIVLWGFFYFLIGFLEESVSTFPTKVEVIS